MKIELTNDRTINEVKEEFHKMFPFLKIEFFTKAHQKGDSSSELNKINGRKKLGEIRKNHHGGPIHIIPDMKVSTLEKHFQEQFGLNVQVYRNLNGVWLITTLTDDWTLNEQSLRSMESNQESPAKYGEKDFDLEDFN